MFAWERLRPSGHIMGKCCDICGDVGVREAIISCSQCQSSNEHKYCTRTLLEEHLDDWLCEDCESSSKSMLLESSPTRDLPNLSKSANSVEVCNGVVLHGENRNLLNESRKLFIDWAKKVATGKTKYICAEEVITLPSGAMKSLSPSKVTSNSILQQPQIGINLSSQQDLDSGPFQQLKTQGLDNIEISEWQQPQSRRKLTDMPPKHVGDQPVIDEPIVGPSTAENSPDARTQKRRQQTRAAHSDRLRRYIKEKGKIPVIFRKKVGRPIGKYASAFMTELGVAVKKFAPLRVSSWKKITEEQKQPIFDRLERAFIVDFGTGPTSVKKETDKLMNIRYRNIRQKMHKHYKTLIDLPWEERLQYVPNGYCNSKADWEFLCTLFESETFKKQSEVNATNRAKLPYNHCGGSKSFVRYSYDGGNGSRQKDHITVFKETHYNSTKGWVGENAETVYNNMVRLREEYRQKQAKTDTQDDGSQSMEEVNIADRVCDQVLGKGLGYIRELGNGPRPAKSTSSDATSRRATNARLRDEFASTQSELHSTRIALESTENKIQMLEANQKRLEETIHANKQIVEANQWMTMQIFERIAPDIVQSLTQQPSSSALPPPPL